MKKQTSKINIAINGFGRIGRAIFKIAQENPRLKIVAINDLTDNATLAHLLKYDSVYGLYPHEIKNDDKFIYVDNQKYPAFSIKEAEKLPWKKLAVDIVFECTGHLIKDGAFLAHQKAGAKKVILSAPAKGKPDVATYLLGVNDHLYKKETVVSNASCTTNSIAPVTAIIDQKLNIKQAFLTTVHSYTADQNLVDGPHKDLRRARSAAHNIIPTSTGATLAVTRIIPKLKNKFDGLSLRVPTICGSISDLTFLVTKKTDAKQVNAILKQASQSKQLKNILGYTDEEIVSSDIIGSKFSGIVDGLCTQVLGGNLVKVLVWYDNEWGYSNRMVEMAEMIA